MSTRVIGMIEVNGLRVRGDFVDQLPCAVGQCAELGDRGAVPGVVRLGDRVEHVEAYGLAELVDAGLLPVCSAVFSEEQYRPGTLRPGA
ncbi:hypothetical protein ACFV47_35825 [Streptomyces solisilvae]|uniref:hypothetical protein n=1 Tax=Streptomyces malaysiensis TaxID=92644 RepID=UPI0036910589